MVNFHYGKHKVRVCKFWMELTQDQKKPRIDFQKNYLVQWYSDIFITISTDYLIVT